jgi:hypothetical protein
MILLAQRFVLGAVQLDSHDAGMAVITRRATSNKACLSPSCNVSGVSPALHCGSLASYLALESWLD